MLLHWRLSIGVFLCVLLFSTSVPILVGIGVRPAEGLGGEGVVVLTGTSREFNLNHTLYLNLTTQPFVADISPEVIGFTTLKGAPIIFRGVELAPFLRFDGGRLDPDLPTADDGNIDFPDGVIVGTRLATELGLAIGDRILLTGSTTNHFREEWVIGLYTTDSIAGDELLLPMPLARKLADLAADSYLLLRVVPTDTTALFSFLAEQGQAITATTGAGNLIPTPDDGSDGDGSTGGAGSEGPGSTEEQLIDLLPVRQVTKARGQTDRSYISLFIEKGAASISLVVIGFLILTGVLVFVGLQSLLSRSVLEKEHQFRLMHTIGAGPAALLRLVITEVAILAGSATVIGVAAGSGLALLIHKMGWFRVFGHTLAPVIDPVVIGLGIGLGLFGSILAGILVILRLQQEWDLRKVPRGGDPGAHTTSLDQWLVEVG